MIMKAVGYGRCSTMEQASEGTSIEVQRRMVAKAADARNLELLEAKQAEVLIFTRVDRASRKTEDFARLISLSEQQGWQIIVTEMGIDTRTPMGKAMAHMAAVFAELERDFIRQRTREGLAVRRDQGVQLGRKRTTPSDVVARVVREHREGKSLYAIARDLNKDAVPCAQGAATWQQNIVRALLKREGAL
jgi:DNA invertase Pin-like site-specific DNA recombinase